MATVTITTQPADDARLAPAFGNLLHGNGSTATAAEVKAWLIAQMVIVVQSYEKQQAINALVANSFTPT